MNDSTADHLWTQYKLAVTKKEIERLRAVNADMLSALKTARELVTPGRFPKAHAKICAAIALEQSHHKGEPK